MPVIRRPLLNVVRQVLHGGVGSCGDLELMGKRHTQGTIRHCPVWHSCSIGVDGQEGGDGDVFPTETSSVLLGQKDGSRAPVPCPSAFSLYNKFMGGVDLGDQLRGYYHVRMKCRKFYQYVAKFLLDVAITNAYVLYRLSHPGTKVTTLKFRDVLANEIIGDYCTRRRAGRNTNLSPCNTTP